MALQVLASSLAASEAPREAPVDVATPGIVAVTTGMPSVQVVFDASAGMATSLAESSTRLDLARNALASMVEHDWDTGLLGLWAHGDIAGVACSGTARVAASTTHDAAARRWRSFAKAIEPGGASPVEASLRSAADALPDGRGHIVLLTSGADTCGGDPCALVRAWNEEGRDLRVHVVGFGLEGDDRKAMTCVAKASATRYHDVRTASEVEASVGAIHARISASALVVEATNGEGESVRVLGTARCAGDRPRGIANHRHNRVSPGPCALEIGIQLADGTLFEPVQGSADVAARGETRVRIVVTEPPRVQARFVEDGESVAGTLMEAYQNDAKVLGVRPGVDAYLSPGRYSFRAIRPGKPTLTVVETLAPGDRKTIDFDWSAGGSSEAPSSEATRALSSSGETAVDLLIENVTIISPERAKPLANAWVLITDGRIVEVGQGPAPSIVEDEGARPTTRIDGGGRFLTPGLIDSHVHLASIPGLPIPTPPSLRALAAAYERQLPRSYLFHGFTTVIDLNVVDRGAIDRFDAAPQRPDRFDCDGALALANGYPMVFLPPMFRFSAYRNFVVDPDGAPPPAGFKAEAHSPASAASRVAEAGGICTKSFWEDGFGDAKIWPTPSVSLLSEVVQASHARGLTTTVHANAREAWSKALDAGPDVLVHGMWNWDGAEADQGLPSAVRATLDRAIEAGVGVMPTVRVIAGLQAMFTPAFLDAPELRAVLPEALIDWYRSDDGRWFAESMRNDDFGGAPDARVRQGLGRPLGQGARVTGYLASNGGTILFGSDTPSGPTYGNPPGLNGYLEMRHLVAAGVSLHQLLDAATRANAKAFHLEDRYGTIEAGKVANLLLLDANPLESVEAWDAIHTVVLHGSVVARSSLAAN